MRFLPIALTILILMTTATVPPAAAAAAGCAVLSPAPRIPAGLLVPPPYPNFFTGPCPGGLRFTSTTAPCPLNLAPVTLPGEYCGAVPGFLPGATITCTGVTTPEVTFEALVVGLDFFPYNGNVFAPEPLTYEGVYPATVHSASITNPGPLPARVIAYPVGVNPPTGPVYVNCI